MLDAMQLESKYWPELGNLSATINECVIVPQTVLNYGEYHNKLQNLAFFSEQGDHEGMQQILDNKAVMD